MIPIISHVLGHNIMLFGLPAAMPINADINCSYKSNGNISSLPFSLSLFLSRSLIAAHPWLEAGRVAECPGKQTFQGSTTCSGRNECFYFGVAVVSIFSVMRLPGRAHIASPLPPPLSPLATEALG